MGFPLFLVAVFLLRTVASQEVNLRKGNDSFYLSANDELSAAALNVRVNFQPYDETWNAFKTAFGRQYGSQVEESYRYQTFLSNVKLIELHNTKFQNGQTTYWMGINQFADMSVEEYQAYNRLRPKGNRTETQTRMRCSPFMGPLNYAVPDTVDWRQKGYVTPVKNQLQCGSCWAFSTTGSVEGQHYRSTGRLVSLSEQQLVDCAGSFGPQGCNGGNEPPAYAYIASVGGIETESSYPYEGRDGQCRFSRSKVAAKVTGCRFITKGSERDLQLAVSSQGPVSVNIDASKSSFQFYSGGVYVEPDCGKTSYDLDHAVLAVGYGYSGAQDYCIVKNSWGLRWGSKGYILMARNQGNMCGIATEANLPVV